MMHRDVHMGPTRRGPLLLAALCLLLPALALPGCGTTPDSRFYVLTPTAPDAPVAEVSGPSVLVAPVSLPAAVDRSQMVTSVSTNQRELAEFERWAEPLGENVTRVVEQNLEARLGQGTVYGQQSRWLPSTDYRVAVEVLALDAAPADGSCTLDARFHIADGAGRWLVSGRAHAATERTSDEPGAVAEAFSSNLGALSDAIVESLRQLQAAE